VSQQRPPRDAGAANQHNQEVPLPGGIANRGKVVRIGNTVHRPQRDTSPAAHALLHHLETVGFDGAPRFLGVDPQGREILTYIPGTPAIPPYPDWALTDHALVSVAELLRAYHHAVANFDPTPYNWPPSPPRSMTGHLVSHNDPNLDNIIFQDGRAVALIDFDLASPGSRLWDVACAARLWAPLRPDTYIPDVRRGRAFQRLHLFVDSYGLDRAARSHILSAVQQNQQWFFELVEWHIAAGHRAFQQYKKAETRMSPEAYARWLSENRETARVALEL
jgi:Phosphotransferase enzyme family